ncbi:hypothetical protein [Gallaecimonas sp. GXIMD4217]|uniref:hypothetical protein n=1 Tax=Gallaecimonas sp. GXIMD4217 TaxID=3131927 RepID=UPI00311B3A9D
MLRILVILLTLMAFSPGQSLAMGEGRHPSAHAAMDMTAMAHDCCQDSMDDCNGDCDMGCHQAPISLPGLGTGPAPLVQGPLLAAVAAPLNPGPEPPLRPPRP